MARFVSRGTSSYTHMVVYDIYQTEESEIVYIPASKSSTIVGIGRYNIQVVGSNVAIHTTLDSEAKLNAERPPEQRYNPSPKDSMGFTPVTLDEGEHVPITDLNQSKVVWNSVGEGESFFELFSPVTAFAIEFNGTGGKVTLALN